MLFYASKIYQRGALFLKKTNLHPDAIKQIDGIDCIDVDHLPMKYVRHKFKYHRIDWNRLLMLVDISHRCKRYSTLVIEKDMHCYQLYDSTTALINHRLEQECFLNEKLSNSLCNTLAISNKRPIVNSQASLIPLQARNKSRCHSWVNTNLVDYTVSGYQSGTVFLYTPDEDIYIKINERPLYLKKKFEDVQQIILVILDIRKHFDLISQNIGAVVSNNPMANPQCRFGRGKSFYKTILKNYAEELRR